MFRIRRKRLLVTLLICNSMTLGFMLSPTFGIQLVNAACGYNCWSIVSSPNSNPAHNHLADVAFFSANSGLAVGTYDSQAELHTLIEAWDGTQWNLISSPNPGTAHNQLNSVTVVPSANYAWAAGWYQNDGGISLPLVLRSTNGGSTWAQATLPSGPGTVGNELKSLHAISTTNVWAVGQYFNSDNVYKTLIEHWDGSNWSVVSSPNVANANNYLQDVMAVSSNDVWAVGYYSFLNDSVVHTRILHWDGTSWSAVASPDGGTAYNALNGVTAVSANDVWAVGTYRNSGYKLRTLTEHWNGTNWSVVSSPNATDANENALNSVAAVASNHVWAVGFYNKPPYLSLAMKWNGTSWEVVVSPNEGSMDNALYGVAVRPGTSVLAGGEVWSVGHYVQQGNERLQTLIMEYILPNLCCSP